MARRQTQRQREHQALFKEASTHCVLHRGPREKYTTCMSKQLSGLGGGGKRRGRRGRKKKK
jgi:hypothetical protein